MRDNGIPEARGQEDLDWFARLAQEALGRLVTIRDLHIAEIKKDLLDTFLGLIQSDAPLTPDELLNAMGALHVGPEGVACGYVPAAAREIGLCWERDELTFVDVTIRTERLHALVRRIDEELCEVTRPTGPSALILVAEAEQHTLGASVLALQLRRAGFTAMVRVAPVAAELTLLMGGNRFDLALVSIGCTAGLDSGAGLVRTLKLMSRGEMCIFVGGAIPLPDDKLLAATGADRILRDVSAIVAEYDACVASQALDRDGKKREGNVVQSPVKGDGVDK